MNRTALFTLVASLLTSVSTFAQSTEVVLTQTVEPSFRIEPVVHRFSARRGEVIPFAFAINSLGKEMDVMVQPVNLRQEESGIILHGESKQSQNGLRIVTPKRFKLSPGQSQTIEGNLEVPTARTNYLSYGILVREAGAKPKFEQSGDDPTKAGIRFVTQYVLRVDVETGVLGTGSVGEMRIEESSLIAEHGMPKIRSFLNNPTNFAFECYVTANLKKDRAEKSRPIRLGMQSRKALEEDKRYLVRIMPHSRLLLEAPVNQALSPGNQLLHVGLTTGRRENFSADFDVNVREKDFPALAVQRAVAGHGVSITPAQIEIGSIGETSRTVSIQLANTSEESAEVSLALRSLDGKAYSQVKISPNQFALKSGRTKNVRAMLRSGGSELTECCTLFATVKRSDGTSKTIELPMSVLREVPSSPELVLGNIQWKQHAEGAGFSTTVENQSNEYVPITANMNIAGASGTQLQLEDGYGEWLAPGARRELHFRPNEPIPTDDYSLNLRIFSREGFPPVVREINVKLNGNDVAKDTLDREQSQRT